MVTRAWQKRRGIMLCYPLEEKRIDKWNIPFLYVQPKLDGDRCRAIIRNGSVILLSSEENEIISVPHIEYDLMTLDIPDLELDGELYSHGMLHQNIHGIVSTKTHTHDRSEMVEYHVFDIVLNKNQIERLSILNTLFQNVFNNCRYVKMVPTYTVESDINKVISEMYSFNKEGYEGIIVRNPKGVYVRRRSTDMMKFKPRKEDAYTVIGYEEEISKEGERKGSLGALILKSDENQIFKVGSGSFLTRAARKELWEERESLKGRIAQVAYQNLTEGHVPRFPILIDLLSILPQDLDNASGVEETTAGNEKE